MTTWKEFKDQVEAAGVQDTDEIAYIDCGSDSLSVKREQVDADSEGNKVWEVTIQ